MKKIRNICYRFKKKLFILFFTFRDYQLLVDIPSPCIKMSNQPKDSYEMNKIKDATNYTKRKVIFEAII